MDFGSLDSSHLAPSTAKSLRPHFVQMYDDERVLVEAVSTFASAGIDAGETVILVATKAHRDLFEPALVARGADLLKARREGRYVSLDADEMLARFMRGGRPDPESFRKVIGSVVEIGAANGKDVRIFGEMVALLWTRGEVAAAIRLEELWNELAGTYPFRLFCAYPAHGFGSDSLGPLARICHEHSHVVPPHR